ncbi:hypothetical protein KP509_03G021000 [Ceratopteris richardii]|uniref:Pre-mRNA polyadenylation factor Fip1 domain-containing protein n=1 Tax=Ceratopteris richardii TaxID=49495 RepID=A0A8T2V552_CERRI|nr:hypothetical protein KP509_03G021000 [Ceratopteris richardii]
MAMAACAEDEFGKLFGDIDVGDIHALRGYGSVRWSVDDESDTSIDTPSGKVVPEEGISEPDANGCHPCLSPAKVNLDAPSVRISPNTDCQAQSIGKGGNDAQDTGLHSNTVETDSDDDLNIVLNPSQECPDVGSPDESEDGEDFVVLTGNEVAGKEWSEDFSTPVGDGAPPNLGGEQKPGRIIARSAPSGKTTGLHPRTDYGAQTYRRHYKYIRTRDSDKERPNLNGIHMMPPSSKSIYSKYDRLGSQGVIASHRFAGRTSAARGVEYVLPFNKTVFDVDIDAFKEKPWRHSGVDVSDYFNFGLDESGWKKYCKELAQFCLEKTTYSKINVYEGGYTGKLKAWDIQEEGHHHRQHTTEGSGELRDSDAILLIKEEDDSPQMHSEDHHTDVQDSCKAPSSSSPNLKNTSKHKLQMQDRKKFSVNHRRETTQKGLESIVQEYLGVKSKVKGTAAVASRSKTSGPVVPRVKLPIKIKRDKVTCKKSRSSSLKDRSDSGHQHSVPPTLLQSCENMQFADYIISEDQVLNAATRSNADKFGMKLGLKRVTHHAVSDQACKKRRVDSHQANHGWHHASLLIKRLSRMDNLKNSAAYGGKSEAKQLRIHSTIDTLSKSPGRILHGSSKENTLENASMQQHREVEKDQCIKKKGTANEGSKDVLEEIPSECIREKSKEKLKGKKSKKHQECKELVKSKKKVHLPGCPHLKKLAAKRSLALPVENMPTATLVSKYNDLLLKGDVDYSFENIKNENVEKNSKIYKSYLSKQRTKEKRFSDKSHTHLSGTGIEGNPEGMIRRALTKETPQKKNLEMADTYHTSVSTGKDSKDLIVQANTKTLDCPHVGIKDHGQSPRDNVMNLRKAMKALRGKKKSGKHRLQQEMSTNIIAQMPVNGNYPTLANDYTQGSKVIIKETRDHPTHKEMDLQPCIEYKIETLSNAQLANGHGNARKHFGDNTSKGCKKKARKILHRSSLNNLKTQRPTLKDQNLVSNTTNLNAGNHSELFKHISAAALSDNQQDKVRLTTKNDTVRRMECPTTKAAGRDCDMNNHVSNSNICLHSSGTEHFPEKVVGDVRPSDTFTGARRGHSYDGCDREHGRDNLSVLNEAAVKAYSDVSDSSQDEGKQRGRSKFERWKTHSEKHKLDMTSAQSGLHDGSRISFSRKILCQKLGRCSKESVISELAVSNIKVNDEADNLPLQVSENCKSSRNGLVKMNAVTNKGKVFPKNCRAVEKQALPLQHLEHFMAKLEKRRERFNLTTEEEGLLKKSAEHLLQTERQCMKIDRPPRKRPWGSTSCSLVT